jgi:hypothetical protein
MSNDIFDGGRDDENLHRFVCDALREVEREEQAARLASMAQNIWPKTAPEVDKRTVESLRDSGQISKEDWDRALPNYPAPSTDNEHTKLTKHLCEGLPPESLPTIHQLTSRPPEELPQYRMVARRRPKTIEVSPGRYFRVSSIVEVGVNGTGAYVNLTGLDELAAVIDFPTEAEAQAKLAEILEAIEND